MFWLESVNLTVISYILCYMAFIGGRTVFFAPPHKISICILFCPDHPILNILGENLNACEFGDYFYKIIFTIWFKFFYRVFKDGFPIISKLKMVPKSPLNLRSESTVFTYLNRLSRSKRKIILRRVYFHSLDFTKCRDNN